MPAGVDPSPLTSPCVAESGDWLLLEELLLETEGGSSGAREEVLHCGAAARHPKDHSREALGGCSPSHATRLEQTGRRVSRASLAASEQKKKAYVLE